MWVARHRRQGQEVVEADDAHGSGTLDQDVEEIAGGECVIEGPVARSVAEPEPISEVPSLQLGTSSRRSRRASGSVSTDRLTRRLGRRVRAQRW